MRGLRVHEPAYTYRNDNNNCCRYYTLAASGRVKFCETNYKRPTGRHSVVHAGCAPVCTVLIDERTGCLVKNLRSGEAQNRGGRQANGFDRNALKNNVGLFIYFIFSKT